MKLKQLVMCVSILLSGQAWANVTEYCPSPADIRELNPGVYNAPTADGNGEWYGVSQGGQGPVGEFEEAIFVPHKDVEGSTVIGEVQRCGYRLQKGGAVDMRFKREGTVASIDVGGAWEEWNSRYYCTNKEVRGCAFKEIVRPAKH
ncbi:DUF3757 domain-containing protein [Pseudomonas mohnii]|jgi:hypothetical protein|uniref:DUF3757 domain-containing protein n=1 Tax=Pseudomonas TaxID=286 RepID=UPI001029AD8A|nr:MULTISPECIES: DUF3757 domain-containing protein [Pseudomonas]MBH8612038.1 DUF3757 domain-containing protein [Pseudomonas mohnii]MBM6443771.1 DUF3757 domain-containing protein [Pseudomonas sp. MIL9]RZO10089.1 DUF3757 domain-containing protein [Pseudomonas moorei]